MPKALTLTQPWATLVVTGAKRIETRSWSTRYRGLLYIHAAKGFPTEAHDFAQEEVTAKRLFLPFPFGAIVGKVQLVAIWPTQMVGEGLSELERRYGDYSPGRWAWILSDAEELEPIPCKGALGLWEYTP